MIKNIGFASKNYFVNEFAWKIITQINSKINKDLNITLFYEENSIFCIDPRTNCLCINEAYNYNHTVITTEVSVAKRLLDFPCPKVVLYIYNLEWLYERPLIFRKWFDIINNPNLEIIVENNEFAKIVKDIWGREDIKIIKEANIKELYEQTTNNFADQKIPTGRILN